MDIEITLRVNGATHWLSVDTRTTLLDALRERLGLTGPKKDCGPSKWGRRHRNESFSLRTRA